MASLADLRTEIDSIDRAIVDLLARRLQVCEEVADLKSRTGSDVIQPARVREVLATRRQWAIDHGVDADFAEQIFRTLLAETHRIEVAGGRPDTAPEKEAGGDARSALDTVACRIDHVVVAVDNLAGATSSFRGLGFRVETTTDPAVMSAEAGGVQVVLVGPGHSKAVREQLRRHGSGVQHIAIEVLNASFTRDALDAAGVPRLTDVVVDTHGHEQVFAVLDPSTGVQLSFISRTGHRVPMGAENVSAMFRALSGSDPGRPGAVQ
jgi:chorismate mutase-like protein